MWVVWLIVIILLSILEICTVSLVSVWFIASGFISLLLSFIIDSFYVQFLIFGGLGLILMVLTRPILVKKLGHNTVRTNANRVIGMQGVVTSEIKKNNVGEVKVDGKYWSAISKENIKENENVIIDAIEGVKLIVRKEE